MCVFFLLPQRLSSNNILVYFGLTLCHPDMIEGNPLRPPPPSPTRHSNWAPESVLLLHQRQSKHLPAPPHKSMNSVQRGMGQRQTRVTSAVFVAWEIKVNKMNNALWSFSQLWSLKPHLCFGGLWEKRWSAMNSCRRPSLSSSSSLFTHRRN